MGVPCFLIEQGDRAKGEANVWCSHDHKTTVYSVEGRRGEVDVDWEQVDWISACSECGERFDWSDDGPTDYHRSSSTRALWRRPDTGEEHWGVDNFGPGAMWDAEWYTRKGPDGRCLVVILPNGHHWTIDSQSSNCTRPGEDHDCWCRHGEPPNLTVDKNPEPGRSTCKAGGGSIASGTHGEPDYWHGFLRGGLLVD